MSRWPSRAFGDLYGSPSKNGLMAPSKVRGSGALLVNMREIYAFDQIAGQVMERAPLPERSPENWLLRKGDLLFARQSLTLAGAGKVSIVASLREPTTFESHIIRVRLNAAICDPRFYYYFFKSPPGRVVMETIVEQVAAAGIRSSDLARLKVPVPQIAEQYRIAGVLSALDDLIDHNRRLIQAEEVLARSLACGVEVFVPLGALCVPVRSKQVRPQGAVEHYSIPAFDAGASPELVDGSSIQSAKQVLSHPAVLVSRLNPKWERAWLAYPGQNAVASTEFVALKSDDISVEEVWALVSATSFWAGMRERVTGTTGSHQRVDKDGLLQIPVPDVRLAHPRARAAISSVVRHVQTLREEIRELTRTRDQLMPVLMSGKVYVRDVESVA